MPEIAITAILKHPLVSWLMAGFLALAAMYGVTEWKLVSTRNQLHVAVQDAAAAHGQLDALAVASKLREEAAQAKASTALALAKTYQGKAAQLLALPAPAAGVDHCAAASALITSTLAQEAK